MGRPSGMRGLVATRDIAEGESIIEIPLSASLEVSDAKTEKDLGACALTLLQIYKEASDSQPYLDLLPPPGAPEFSSMPDFFTDGELEMMQCPTAAMKTRRRRELCAATADEHSLSVDEVKWALCSVTARSFTVLSPVDGLLRLLLPGIDLLNHDADAPHKFKVRWNLHGEFSGLFKVVAGAAVKQGDEVCICYGGNPYRTEGCGGECSGDMAWTNEQYLQRYGFVDTSFGTTMVDGRWLVTEAASSVRDALSQTSAAEDEALLAEGQLSSAARTAVQLRLHLKRALVAQREVEAAREAAAAKGEDGEAGSQGVAEAQATDAGEAGHYSKEAVRELGRAAQLAREAAATAGSEVSERAEVSPA